MLEKTSYREELFPLYVSRGTIEKTQERPLYSNIKNACLVKKQRINSIRHCINSTVKQETASRYMEHKTMYLLAVLPPEGLIPGTI